MAKRKVYTPEGRVYEQSRGAQGKPPPAPANKRKVYTPEGRVYEQSRGAQGKPPPAPANKPYTPRWTGGTSGSTQPFWKQPQFRQTVRPPAQPTAPEPEPDRGWFGNLLHRAGDVFKMMMGISSPAAGPIQAAKQMGLVENPPMTTIQVRDIYGKQTPVDISGGKNNRDRLFFKVDVVFNSMRNWMSAVGSQSALGKIGKGIWAAGESAYFASPMRKALDDWNHLTHLGRGGVYLNSKGEVVPPNRVKEFEADGEKLQKVSYHDYALQQQVRTGAAAVDYFREAMGQTEATPYATAKRYGWQHSAAYEAAKNSGPDVRNLAEAAEQYRARQFLIERSEALTVRAFQSAQSGDLETARNLRREAIQLDRDAGSSDVGVAGLYDPYFSYTWITNPEREQAFIDATIDAELQLGRELTPFEIWKMRDVYVDPWREIAGDSIFDWTNFMGGAWDDAVRLAAKPFTWAAKSVGTALTHMGGPIGDTARWLSKRAVRSQAGKLAHSANDVLAGIAHAAKRVGAGEVGYEEFLRSLGQVADAVKTGIGQPGRLGGLPPEFGSRQEREILGMANAFGSDPELARRLGPDGWANMAEDARRDVYQQAYDRILAAEQRKVTQYEDLAYQDLVRRGVAGTEDELREQARTLAQEQIIEKAGREAAAVAYDPANLVSHMSAQFKRGYLEVHAGDMRLPGRLGDLQSFNEKFMGGWTRAVLSARPAWVIRNYMDNAFRALVFGTNPFADIGTLIARYGDDAIPTKLREAGLLPTETTTSFARSELNGDELSIYQRLEIGERPRWFGDLWKYNWERAAVDVDGKTQSWLSRMYSTLTNSITDWNALVEFSFKVRMFDQQFYKNFYQLNGQAWQYVTRVLRERGASDADIALAQRIWNAARTNPSKANEMLKGLQMSDNSLVRAAMLMPPDLDNMLSRMPVEARAGLIDSVSRQLEDAMEAARLAGKEVGEAEIRKFFDDLLTDFRAQQAKIVNKPDLRDAPGTPKVGAEPEFDETLPANPPGEVAPGLHEVHHPAREASEALATATDGTKIASYLRDCVSERYVVVTGTVDGKPYDIQVVDGRVTITLSPNALTGKPKQVRSTLQNALRDAIIAEDNLITKADFDQFLKNPAKLKADKPDAYQRIAARMDNDPDLRKTLASLRGERSLSYTSLLDETGDAAETQINQLVKEGATREEAVRSLRKPEVYTSGDRQGVAMARARDLEDSLPTSDPRRGILTTYLTRYESVRNLLESWTLHVWPNPLGASDYGIRSRRWDLRDEIIVSMYNKMADDLDWTVAHLDNLTQEDAIPSLSQFLHDMGFGFEFRKDGTLRKILYFPPGSKRPMPQSNWAVDAFIHHFFGKNQTNTGDMRRLIMETPYTRQLQYNGASALPESVTGVPVERAAEAVAAGVQQPAAQRGRSSLLDAMTKRLGAEKAHADLMIIDELGRSWATENGKTMDDWYNSIRVSMDTPEKFDGLLQNAQGRWYYSKVTQTIEQKMPNRATAEQIRGILKGNSPSEIEWSNLNEFLASKGDAPIAKQEVLDFLDNWGVQLEEKILGEPTVGLSYDEAFSLGLLRQEAPTDDLIDLYVKDPTSGEEIHASRIEIDPGDTSAPYSLRYRDLTGPHEERFTSVDAAMRRAYYVYAQPGEVYVPREAQYSQVRIPGGENYREFVFHWNPAAHGKDYQGYRSPHFGEYGQDLIAHARVEDRVDEQGRRVLFVMEVQSDWHQAGRKVGYGTEGGVPPAPFANNWDQVVMKRMIRYAADNGYDVVAFPTGAVAAKIEGHPIVEGIDRLVYNEVSQTLSVIRDGQLVRQLSDVTPNNLKDYVGDDIARQLVDSPELRVSVGKYQGDNGWYVERGSETWNFSTESEAREFAGNLDTGIRQLNTKDVTFGGEKMRWFYDDKLINDTNKVLRPWGARVEDVSITGLSGVNKQVSVSLDEAERLYNAGEEVLVRAKINGQPLHPDAPYGGYVKYDRLDFDKMRQVTSLEGREFDFLVTRSDPAKAHGFALTDEMRRSVQVGQSLFQKSGDVVNGMTTLADDGQAMIHLLSSTNVSTPLHEAVHIRIDRASPEDVAVMADYLKTIHNMDVAEGWHRGTANREAVEKIARAFENYVTTGEAPTPKLKQVFEKIKQWMLDVYKTVTGSEIDIEISPALRNMFDEWLGKKVPMDDALRSKVKSRLGLTLDPSGTRKLVDRRKDPTLRALVDKIKRGEGLTAEESKAFMDRAFVQATGLPNKIYFEFVVSGSAQELPYKTMIDLDFLKWFNDTGGHAIGDDLLQAFADDLKAVAGDNNAFHFSGDEFAAQFQDAASAEKAMQELQQRFAAREFVFKELTKDGKETGQQVTARNLSFGWGGGDTIESADKVLVARKKTARSTRGSEPSGTTRGPAEAGLAGRQGGAEWVDLTPEELAAIDKIRQENILHLNKEEIREVRARTGLNVDAQGQIDGQFATPEQMAEIQKVQQLVTKRTAIRNSWQQPVTKLTDPKAQAMLQSEANEMLLDVFHLEGMDGRPAAFKDVLEGVSWGKAIAKHLPEEDARQAFVTAMGKVMRGEADNSDLAKAIRKALAQNVEQGVTGKVERLAHPYAYTALEYTPEQTTDLLDRWSTALRRNPMEELEGMTAAQQNRAALWDAFTQSVWTGDRTIQQSWGQYANSPELLTAKLRDMLERLPEGTSPEAIESIQMLLFQVQNFHAISNNMAGFLGLQRSLRNSADEILPLMPSPARMPENYQQFFAAGDESLKQIAQIEDALKHWSEYAQGQAKAGTWAAVDPQTARILAGSADDVSRILQSTINLAKHGPEPDLRAQIDEVVGAIVNKNMTHKRVGREWVPLTAQEKASIKRVTENWGKYQEFLQQFTNVPEGALPRTNRFMIDYSDFSQLDEVIKQFVPFWTFSSRSFPFWAETMATHPQIISFYNKYIAHNRRIQYQEGLYTSTGSPMPSLEGYVRIPGTEIWFNPLAPFSFRYVLMPFTKQYSQEYEADSIMNQIMMWAYDYSMLYGVSFSPWLTVPAGFFGWFGDNPVSGVVPQVNLMPPWWREGIRQVLNKIGGTQAVHLGNAIIGSDAPWKDYMVERRLMADAYERMQRARTDAEKLEIAMEISTILQLKDRSQSDLWNKTLREIDMSELGRAWGGYMTGIYSKEFTDAEAEFQRIRDDLNFYRDMINNEVGAEIFALDPSAENRYELYKDKVYNTPEGFLAGLYNIIRWTRTPEGEQLYGQERREYVSKEILESEVTSAYYDTLNALRQSYQDKLAQLPIGAESKLKQALWEEYYAKRAEIEQMPEYELARRGWSEGYKPAEMLYEHYQSLWWQMIQETKPQWDRTNESWDEYLLKEQEWLADLPQNAAALSSTWNEILAKDLKTEDLDKVMAEGKSLPGGRTMNVSEIVKRLQKETNAEGYLAWKRSRDSALDAMDEAWKELYWNPYWENLKGLKGYERDLAEAEWLEANPVPTAAQLAAWVKQTYGDQFQLNELLLAAQGRSVESVTERQAPENDIERMEQQIWDILAMAGPNKKALQNAYEALGGYWSDISTFYNVGGNGAAWSDPEKFQAMHDKLVQAASNLGLREPSPQLLREWTEAQALDKNLDVVITTQLGDDIMEVMADYWNADSATRRQMRKADPRIDMYYKLRDLYAEQYPLWAKYYLQASSTSGGSSGGSGKSYSGGGGGRYYSRGGGGSGSRRSGGSSSGYSTGGAPRIGMGYRSSLDAARLLDPSAVGRGGTAGQVRLPPLPAPSVLQPALPPDMVTRPLEPEPTEKPPIPPPDLPLF